MRLPASTALKLHAAVCAGEALICLRLGAAVPRAQSVPQAVHPAPETTASGDHQPDTEAAAGLASLAYELLDAHADAAQLADGLYTTAPGRRTLTIYAPSNARAGKRSHAPLPRSSRIAFGPAEGGSMFVELETRHGDGLTVTLEWDRDSGQTQTVVHDIRSNGLIAFGFRPPTGPTRFVTRSGTRHEWRPAADALASAPPSLLTGSGIPSATRYAPRIESAGRRERVRRAAGLRGISVRPRPRGARGEDVRHADKARPASDGDRYRASAGVDPGSPRGVVARCRPSRYIHRRGSPPAALRTRGRHSFFPAARASARSRLGCSRRCTSRASRPIFWSAPPSAPSTPPSSHRGPSSRRRRGI